MRSFSHNYIIFLVWLFGPSVGAFCWIPQISRSAVNVVGSDGFTLSKPIPKRLELWSQGLAAVDAFYQAAPYAAGALTCGVKASAADYVAQKRVKDQENRPHKIHLTRNLAFLVYGSLYQGVAQEFIYNHCYTAWFGTSSKPVVVIQKVLFDLLVQTTLVTLPVAYLTKAAIFRYSVREAFRRYREDVIKNGLLKKYFLLWGPVQCLTFSVVPEHLRISFIAAVSFFWLIILSTISGRTDTTAPAQPTYSVRMEKTDLRETANSLLYATNSTLDDGAEGVAFAARS